MTGDDPLHDERRGLAVTHFLIAQAIHVQDLDRAVREQALIRLAIDVIDVLDESVNGDASRSRR